MVLINIRVCQSILGQHDKALATARRAVAVMEELRRRPSSRGGPAS